MEESNAAELQLNIRYVLTKYRKMYETKEKTTDEELILYLAAYCRDLLDNNKYYDKIVEVAKEVYPIAIELGKTELLIDLGDLYFNHGYDKYKALEFYQKSADLGNSKAIERIHMFKNRFKGCYESPLVSNNK